jgi:caffeoyl-CoA O-methyltransferase
MMTPSRWTATQDYLRDVFGREDPLLAELRAEADRAGLPPIAVSADVGRLLDLLVRTTAARAVLELGTLGGYSAIWLGRALAPGGRLVTVEIDPARAAFARRFLARAGLADRVTVMEGAALDVIPAALGALGGALDVAFLDAVKTEYPAYLAALRGHIAPGGLLLADNVLGSSRWWIDDVGHPDRDAVDAFNRALAADPAFDVAAVPLREGVLVARRR